MIPFEIKIIRPVHRQLKDGVIYMNGDMTPSSEVEEKCQKILEEASLSYSHWAIDSSQVRLHVGAEEIWSKLVTQLMSKCHLSYLPSSLAMNLEYDDLYLHPNSEFLET